MTSLDDAIWQQLTGAYKLPYDASIILKRLALADQMAEESDIWDEIWNELHHQSDLGTASYLAIPQLIGIAKSKERADANLFSFIAVVETERHQKYNPEIPKGYETEYFEALQELPEIIKLLPGTSWDHYLTSSILSALAAIKGQIKMAKVVNYLADPDYLQRCYQFLKNA